MYTLHTSLFAPMCTCIPEVRTYWACVYVLCMNMRCLLPEISRQVAASRSQCVYSFQAHSLKYPVAASRSLCVNSLL